MTETDNLAEKFARRLSLEEWLDELRKKRSRKPRAKRYAYDRDQIPHVYGLGPEQYFSSDDENNENQTPETSPKSQNLSQITLKFDQSQANRRKSAPSDRSIMETEKSFVKRDRKPRRKTVFDPYNQTIPDLTFSEEQNLTVWKNATLQGSRNSLEKTLFQEESQEEVKKKLSQPFDPYNNTVPEITLRTEDALFDSLKNMESSQSQEVSTQDIQSQPQVLSQPFDPYNNTIPEITFGAEKALFDGLKTMDLSQNQGILSQEPDTSSQVIHPLFLAPSQSQSKTPMAIKKLEEFKKKFSSAFDPYNHTIPDLTFHSIADCSLWQGGAGSQMTQGMSQGTSQECGESQDLKCNQVANLRQSQIFSQDISSQLLEVARDPSQSQTEPSQLLRDTLLETTLAQSETFLKTQDANDMTSGLELTHSQLDTTQKPHNVTNMNSTKWAKPFVPNQVQETSVVDPQEAAETGNQTTQETSVQENTTVPIEKTPGDTSTPPVLLTTPIQDATMVSVYDKTITLDDTMKDTTRKLDFNTPKNRKTMTPKTEPVETPKSCPRFAKNHLNFSLNQTVAGEKTPEQMDKSRRRTSMRSVAISTSFENKSPQKSPSRRSSINPSNKTSRSIAASTVCDAATSPHHPKFDKRKLLFGLTMPFEEESLQGGRRISVFEKEDKRRPSTFLSKSILRNKKLDATTMVINEEETASPPAKRVSFIATRKTIQPEIDRSTVAKTAQKPEFDRSTVAKAVPKRPSNEALRKITDYASPQTFKTPPRVTGALKLLQAYNTPSTKGNLFGTPETPKSAVKARMPEGTPKSSTRARDASILTVQEGGSSEAQGIDRYLEESTMVEQISDDDEEDIGLHKDATEKLATRMQHRLKFHDSNGETMSTSYFNTMSEDIIEPFLTQDTDDEPTRRLTEYLNAQRSQRTTEGCTQVTQEIPRDLRESSMGFDDYQPMGLDDDYSDDDPRDYPGPSGRKSSSDLNSSIFATDVTTPTRTLTATPKTKVDNMQWITKTPMTPAQALVSRRGKSLNLDSPMNSQSIPNSPSDSPAPKHVVLGRGKDPQYVLAQPKIHSYEQNPIDTKLGIRRSTRNKVRPLRRWLNEKPVYELDEENNQVLKGVESVEVKYQRAIKVRNADVLAQRDLERQEKTRRRKRNEFATTMMATTMKEHDFDANLDDL